MRSLILFWIALLCLVILDLPSAAQEPVLQWKYDAGNWFTMSMSPNSQYVVAVARIWPEGNPERGYHEVLLLDHSGRSLWKQKWDEPDDIVGGIAVSNSGYVAVASYAGLTGFLRVKGKLESFNFIYLLDSTGKVLWRKKVEGGVRGDICISPEGDYIAVPIDGNPLCVLDKNGDVVWCKKAEGYNSFSVQGVSENGSIIVAHEGNSERAEAFDSGGNRIWSMENCPTSGRVSVSPNGKWAAVLVKEESEDITGLFENTFVLLDQRGATVAKGGVAAPNWQDFSVSNDGVIALVEEDDLRNNYVALVDLRSSSEKSRVVYRFEIPRGKHSGGLACVEISADGEVIAVSTPYEIHYLRMKKLEKKW